MKKYSNYFLGLSTIILVNFNFDYDLLSSTGIGVFVFWVVSLINASNKYFPIIELFFCLFSLQFLFSPALSYNGFDEYTNVNYRMKINSDSYFSYVIPLFIIFPVGFNVFLKPNSFKPDIANVNMWLKFNPNIPYVFIIIGFVTSLFSNYIPSNLSFVGYFLESFKFIGVFILILGYQKIKPLVLIGVYGGILLTSFVGGMFHDLLIWIIILGLVISFRYKPKLYTKFIAIVVFAIFASFIQSIKGGLRQATWGGNEKVSIELLENINKANISENSGFFTMLNIAPQINRVNQGWILASTMNNVPANEPHTYGKNTYDYLHASLMPRILSPNKLKSGDQNLFNRYSGHVIIDSTAMGLGLFTDAYIEFGKYGAILYIFVWGLMYGFILKQFVVRSEKYPILILFALLAFLYPMRPDCETQTGLGHLFKTIMLLMMIIVCFKKSFALPQKNARHIILDIA